MSDRDLSPMSLKHKIALVTGATGFIGAHLAKRLINEGWKVHAIIRKGSKLPSLLENEGLSLHLHDGSTNGLVQCVAEIKPDVVFHLASLFLSQHEVKDVEPLVESNLLFGNQLLEAMMVNDVSNLINTGTSWQHYENKSYNPVCLYAATKQAFETLLEYYVQACDFRAITLKLFDTYGSNDLRPKLFTLLNQAAINDQTLNMSSGDQLIDLVHIDDVIQAYLIAANRLLEDETLGHEIYAVSSGSPIALKKMVQLYIKTTGINIKINWGARPYRFREVMNTWAEGKSIKGWRPNISLENGFKNLDC
jgi:nucleoside-diphosphate-sugar epimerase